MTKTISSKMLAIVLAVFVALTFMPVGVNAAVKTPGKTAIKSISVKSANTVTVKWKKAKHATKYQVYKKDSGKWKLAATTKKLYANSKIKYDVKTYFKVRAVNGKKKGKYSAIKYRIVKRIRLNKSELQIENGSNGTLSLKNAIGSVTWRSDDTKVATVNSGVVTPKKPGVVTITAKSKGQTADCIVFVNGYLDASAGYDAVNEFRASKGVWFWNEDNKTKTYYNKQGCATLAPLTRNADLEETARIRAKEVSILFSHSRPDGTLCFTAFPDNLWPAAENIASGRSDIIGAIELLKESKEKFEGQGHRRNMLAEDIGMIGIAGYMYNGTEYWVQDFAY